MRPHRIGALLLITAAGLGLPSAGAASAGTPSLRGQAAAAKAPCSSQKKALQRANGGRKKQARKRYDACLKAVKARLAGDVKRQLTDQRLVGKRGDGQSVDWLFCANGKYRLETTDRSGRGISDGAPWVVTQVKGSATRFTAIIRRTTNLRAGGLSVGIARRGSKYYVGIESFGDVTQLGEVTRTPDPAACAAL